MNDRILAYLVQESKNRNESVVISYINRSTKELIKPIFAGSDYSVNEFDFTTEGSGDKANLLQAAKSPGLYLIRFADNKRSRIAVSEFIYRMCSRLTDYADRQKNSKLPVETSIYLGEFEYLDRLPKWGIYTGLMRKRNLHVIMLADNFFQLRKVYSGSSLNNWISLVSYNMAFCYGGTLIIRDTFSRESSLNDVYAPFFRINNTAVSNPADEKNLSRSMFKLISGGIHAQGKADNGLFESIDIQDSKFEYHGIRFKHVPRYAPNRLALQLLCGGKITESEFFSTLIRSAYTLVNFVPHERIKQWKIAMLDYLYELCHCVRVDSRKFITFTDDFIACAQELDARTQMYFDFHDFAGFENSELKDVIADINFYIQYLNDLKAEISASGKEEYNADFDTVIKAYRSCFISNDSRLECDFDFSLIAWIAEHNPAWRDRDILNAVRFSCGVDELLKEYLDM